MGPHVGERNYHIFYQLVRGATSAERAQLEGLSSSPRDFAYLSSLAGSSPPSAASAATVDIEGVDDAAEFAEVRRALAAVGIGADVQASIWACLAGLLHLGERGAAVGAAEWDARDTPASLPRYRHQATSPFRRTTSPRQPSATRVMRLALLHSWAVKVSLRSSSRGSCGSRAGAPRTR